MEIIIFFLKSYLALWIGLFIHTAQNFKEARTLYIKSNETLTFKGYLQVDMVTHIINIFCICLWMLLFDYLVSGHPEIEDWLWVLISAVVGYFNSALAFMLFGAAYKKILKVIDDKTNIADNK